jgi:hypothetical protein
VASFENYDNLFCKSYAAFPAQKVDKSPFLITFFGIPIPKTTKKDCHNSQSLPPSGQIKKKVILKSKSPIRNQNCK